MSILDSRPELRREIEKVSEVAGYLWERDGQSATAETLLSMLPNTLMMN